MTTGRPELWVCHLGTVEYREALALQEQIRAARQEEALPDVLLLLEHWPVYTRGRRSAAGELPMGEDWYRMQGIDIVETDRGGKVTYHGPGQLVGYPIVRVDDVVEYVRTLERALVATLAEEGVAARARPDDGPDYTGVWVDERKIASIGVHVARGVTTHGFAVNVENDLQPFSWIVPCGLEGVRMTSLIKETGRLAGQMRCLRRRAAYQVAEALGLRQRLVSLARIQRAIAAPAPAAQRPTDRLTRSPGRPTRSRAHPGGIADVLEILGPEVQPHRGRKPPWFKVPAPGGPRYRELHKLITEENLHTVCQEAACPNIGECWQRGTATFMILGDTCTRRCGFCNVKTGKPTWHDPLEPARVGRSVARMGLRHAVITSVDRDDLPDYGAGAFVGVIRQIRRQAPGCKVEVLTPDFRGEEMPLARVIAERPDVFNHNVEVVPRLYPVARRGSKFERSCRVLSTAKELAGESIVTKSGLMVGLGESFEEMVDTLGTLREHHVQVLTIGQYLRPTEQHLPIVRYWHPEEFAALERAAYELGFEHVAAGPLVRSSYHADEHVHQARPGTGPLAEVAASG